MIDDVGKELTPQALTVLTVIIESVVFGSGLQHLRLTYLLSALLSER